MIYPAEADIIPLVQFLVQALQPYAGVNEVTINFQSEVDKLIFEHHPFKLIQSLSQLICQIINLVPCQSTIDVRLFICRKELCLEVENTGINLIQVNQINNQFIYTFTGEPLNNGTLYKLKLPLCTSMPSFKVSDDQKSSSNMVPHFYAELRKRLRFHFTSAEKLVAGLSHSQPQEAAFLQKINALIISNLEDEQFDTTALCKAMAMSRTQLFRRLKPLIRQAPAHYIKMMRLQKAKELLETTSLTVSEVAFKTGFLSQSHFTKVFLQQYGVLPSIFRRRGSAATNE